MSARPTLRASSGPRVSRALALLCLATLAVGLAALAAGGCESRVSLGGRCASSADCQPPLICGVGDRCRVECATSSDCPSGERCLVDVTVGVPACSVEREPCATECARGLECVAGECQSGCTTSAQCPDSVCTIEGYCLPAPAGADAGPLDTGSLDTGMLDTGISDDGMLDTATLDTGTSDAGTSDTGLTCASGPPIVDVAVGGAEACAVTATGSVYCWGYFPVVADRGTGEDCHLGARECHPRPTLIAGITDAVEVVLTGRAYACVRRTSGAVSCWGGLDGVIDRTLVPIRTDIGADLIATALYAGDDHVCALSARRLLCWGRRGGGRLGDGMDGFGVTMTATPGLRGTSNTVSGAAGYDTTIAVLDDDDLLTVGGNVHGLVRSPPSAEPVLSGVQRGGLGELGSAALSAVNACVLVAGDPMCWGLDDGVLGAGPLGLEPCASGGDEMCTATPTRNPASVRFEELVADAFGTSMFALTATGEVYGWGTSGDLFPVVHRYDTPTRVPALRGATVTDLAVGYDAACAVLAADGQLVCWGLDENGQLGRGVVHPRGSADPSLGDALAPCW